jgi:glycosyltransferase involved in cell wall biosynthesis
MPQLRSAYIERFQGAPTSMTLFLNEEYLDATLLTPDAFRQVSRAQLLKIVARGDYDALALPEPLWIVHLPFVTLLAIIAKTRALVGRRRVPVVTYAIENADSTRLLGLPARVPSQLRLTLLRVVTLPYLLCLDRIAFGTEGARQNYRTGAMAWLHRRFAARTKVFTPLAPACDCPTHEEDANMALFLGPLATRKGLDTLLAAWPIVAAQNPDAHLVVCGTGVLQPLVDQAIHRDPRISQVVTSSRDEIHGLLRRAHVLVSLPRTERRWREQIGLSLTEGLSHSCRIVATDETGFADWLAQNGHVLVSPNDDPAHIAAALGKALSEDTASETNLPLISGRASAENWMLRGQGQHHDE